MGTKRMLIDASHPEETRVVVVDDTRLEDYDVEVASRRQLKGNIYLAKVTRVEPSLQAAFVDYGGNRHGFLAFNEIHPDYYQIPVADRQALLEEHIVEERQNEPAGLAGENGELAETDDADDDDEEVARRRPRPPSRRYKIQEVIKRRQILLVQVVKEERGNKGAALTTYLSLAGRYGVLMPNTVRGGGISRKISAGTDRSRLKTILAELEIPEGMAVIVRTAGAGRSKAEIKRDYEYLLRLWSSIRDDTLNSMAPALVYEEASLIKRSIRDLYGRDIEEIIIQGEQEYRIAKEFMKLFIPSHAKRVKAYADLETPLFRRYGVEEQLEEMHQPLVHLRSGGSIVLNPTEALVAIDVNSGRATRERHIEETALRTNLEAADEIARQLRLRDLAGLVVIDFIDMEASRNRSQVERRLRDAMKADRARVQLGHISQFGLMELSRQRLRPSLLETSFEICAHCGGTGVRPTTETTALLILRKLEEEGLAHRSSHLTLALPTVVAMYLVNEKRKSLLALEAQYGLAIALACDDSLISPDYRIDRVQIVNAPDEDDHAPVQVEEPESGGKRDTAGGDDSEIEREEPAKRGRRRKPRRRKKYGEDDAPAEAAGGEEGVEDDVESDDYGDSGETGETGDDAAAAEEDDRQSEDGEVEQPAEAAPKKRRRGKRGGRRRSRKSSPSEDNDAHAVIPLEAGAEEDGLTGGGDVSVPLEEPAEYGWNTPTEDEPALAASGSGSDSETEAETGAAAMTEAEEAPEAAEAPKRETRRRSTRGDGEKATATARERASDDHFEELDQGDLLQTGWPETAPDDDDGGPLAETAGSPEPAVEADVPSEPPSEDAWESAGGLPEKEEPAESPVAPEPDDAAMPRDRMEPSGETDEDDDRRMDPMPRTTVIEVGRREDAREDDSPRKGWWQRLLD